MSERQTRSGVTGDVLCAAMLGPAVAALLYTALIGNPTVAGAIYYISKAAFAALPVVWLRGVAGLPIGLAGPQPAGLITGLAFAAAACAAVIGACQLPSVDRLDPEESRRRVGLFGVPGHYLSICCLCLGGETCV